MLSYNIFLDDERPMDKTTWVTFPEGMWVVARNFEDFVSTIEAMGLPEFISFDHDLADEHYQEGAKSNYTQFNYDNITEKTGMCCAKWLIEYCIDHDLDPPKWQCHTKNPCGADNINGLLKNYAEFRSKK